ncbi:hypothetical protein [Falsarthrobacter nasiphocae]|uniref:Uncharacterized protein n=1 Tax=Falsarthrobacter nasiphocae TaxID=189863 RepID=A0AAE3YDX1_9MICC|nr:hypothetical protein [Falsarthrobacter nasiphocae]MDR6891390.1 hypothetical protein [Falsarthrobacter nasiphocae]
MLILRRVFMVPASLFAAVLTLHVTVLGLTLLTMATGIPLPIPFVADIQAGSKTLSATADVNYPGATVAVLVLAAIIYAVDLRMTSQDRRGDQAAASS